MQILFVATWFPYPVDNGSRIRVHHLLRALAERHEVHLLAFMPPEAGQYVQDLRAWCPHVAVVERPMFWRDRRKALLGYFSPQPRDVVAGYSPEMADLVKQSARHHRFDAVVASVVDVAPYALLVPDTPHILEEHNFMTRWMEEQYQAQRGPAKRALRRMTWQKCRHYERQLYPQFDACTMVSEQDRRAVLSAIPGYTGRVEVIPNGVDLERNRPGLAEPEPDRLAFNGALTYYANADAMRFFAGEILPLIHRQRPGVRVKITGRTDGVDLSWLPADGSVALTGYLEDVRPAVAGSWACVVPLRSGGGTRLKILEAMALGTPVVATPKGAEGLDVTPEEDILIGERPGEFADQVVRLLADQELRRRLAENGRRLVEAKYGWQEIGRRFCELVEEAVSGAVRPGDQCS